MDLRDYVRIFHANWILILVSTLLGIAIAAGYSLLVSPRYQATTQLFVSVRSEGAATGDLVQGTTFARQVVTSYAEIANSALVLQPVVEELGLDITASQLARQVTATSPLNSVLLEITATDEDPETAAALANATAESFTRVVVDDLEAPEGEDAGPSPVRIRQTEPAAVPSSPVSPNVPLNLVLGALIGFAAGVGAAVLRTVLDTRIHSLHDIATVTEAPVLGGIAFDPDAKARPLIVHADPRNPRAESFRSLRTNVQFLNVEGGSSRYVVTSSGPGEGKSTTTANLAISLAETGARVALIDGDLRLPKVADYMGIEGAVGLTDVLIGRVELVDAMQKWGRGNLFVLPAGRIPPNPAELLGSTAMDRVLAALSEHFDYVLIDSPPLLLVTDAAVLTKKATGALLVTASGATKRPELQGAVSSLDRAGADLLGIVVTMLPTKGPDSYGYGTYVYGAAHAEDDLLTAEPAPTGKAARRRSKSP
ncbi:polysaccharide biosynthesis tyrosine autokinase [Microbacterium sp.]|jgi:capsular exopolysaccharide synthesis family protein|uniref:polysaccharide biosynthesis tyrosine autokinase n=1 Tax=Microbacterium sp. TaxID=51671 RepID=UPI002BDA0918|nr:polysaccharide biosynthesis tyrosine autokinase [Microbacterium sp.]HWL78713.1 polysaccharide biosynthesis tyrosine autokinase [Microbacterium sp.]